MKKRLVAAVVALVVAGPLLVLAFAPAPDAGSRPVEYKTWHGYAESRDSGLKGEASFLALTAKAEFAQVFGPVLTPRGAPDPVPPGAFDKQLFVAVIKRGGVLWDYKVEKVTANGETLTVSYRATPKGRGETARAPAWAGTMKAITTAKAVAATEKAVAVRAETKKEEIKTVATGRIETGRVTVFIGTARALAPAGGTFDSPLILSVPKAKYASVVFIEDGRKAGSVRVGN